MNHLANLSVLILGLGTSGLAMARWCVRHGASVRVWDSRDVAPGDEALLALPQASRLGGALDASALDGVQLVLKSPGLSPRDAKIVDVWQAAGQRGLARQGELELFSRALQDLKAAQGYSPNVVAITGTNGKTTTTALTALLMARAGLRVATAGNIGPSMLDTLTQACFDEQDVAKWPQAWVLELSSFQLDGVTGFEPTAATVLNLTQDHLDWHGDMAAYAAAKARVFGDHAVMVVPRGDDAVTAMVTAATTLPATPGRPAGKALRPRKASAPSRRVLRFGLDAPQAPGDFGLVTEGGMAWLVSVLDDSTGGHRHDSEVMLRRLMPADALRIRGRHNASNALAALALASACGCAMAPMLHGLREYRGEPHRVASVAIVGDVEAFDDSKGTNVGATVAAIEGLGADRAPAKLVLILGGDGKQQDFSPLAAPVAKHARAVALIGRDAGLIELALSSLAVPTQHHATLEEATRWSFEQARTGDAVVMSPACASLDMFRNYEHRAEVFVAAVQAWAHEHGEVQA